MVNLFEIGVNLLEHFITIMFMTLYFGCKYKDHRKYIGFILGWMTDFGTITLLNSLYLYEGFLGLTFMVIYFLYAVLFLKGDVYTKLFISGFINCIVYSIAMFVELTAGAIFNITFEQIFTSTIARIVMIAVTKILLVAVCVLMLKYKFNTGASKRNIGMLIVMPVVAMISMVGIMQTYVSSNALNGEMLLALLGVLLANVLTYYMFIKINTDKKKEAEYNSLQQKYENDKLYYRDVEKLYNKTCGIRHDLLNHFTTLYGLLERDVDSAREYIRSVTQNQLESIRSFVQTDNECFNAIVNAKIAVCETEGIRVCTRIMNYSLDSLENEEIGILFGNLFDNAIEASKRSADKTIELEVQKQGAYLSVFISNSVDESVLENNRELKTTKQNKEYHGFGTKQIKNIVEQHNGIIDFFEENGCFCCDILI